MSWASEHIKKLESGEAVTICPRGNSMVPLIHSGDLVDLVPLTARATRPVKGDIVLCKVRGNVYLHKVTAVRGDQYQISNNHGHVNGWITLKHIYGVVNTVYGKEA